MKLKLFIIIMASFGFTACGKVDESTLPKADVKSSIVNTSGSYALGLNTCEKGHFNSAYASKVLEANEALSAANGATLVSLELKNNELVTSGPSTFFGGSSQACKVTTSSSASFNGNSRLTLQEKSRACSNTCTPENCTEEVSIINASKQIFKVEKDGENLKLTNTAGPNLCSFGKDLLPYQINWIKK